MTEEEDPTPLTPAERRIVQRVADGGTDRTIAEDLGVSRRTVHSHVERATWKTRTHSRAQLVATCLRLGWIE